MRPFIVRYPDFLAGSAEFCDIQKALEPELLDLWSARDSILDQLCVETATWGLPYWEQTLGISVDSSKDLDTRRSRIRVKLLGADVTTLALVQSAAEIYSGGPAEVKEFANQFRLEIAFPGTPGVPGNMRELTKSLREIMPAHLQWDYLFLFEANAAVRAGFAGFAEIHSCLEVWPLSVHRVDTLKSVGFATFSEYLARVEVHPAEPKEEGC